MSKGNKQFKFRAEPDLAKWIEERFERLKRTAFAPPTDVSDFLRRCVEKERDHVRRSNRPNRRRPKRPAADSSNITLP